MVCRYGGGKGVVDEWVKEEIDWIDCGIKILTFPFRKYDN